MRSSVRVVGPSDWLRLRREWRQFLVDGGKSAQTLGVYDLALRRFLCFLAEERSWAGPLPDVPPSYVHVWFAHLAHEGLSPATRNLYRAALANFWRWLTGVKGALRDPFNNQQIPWSKIVTRRVRPASSHEVASMIVAALREMHTGPRDASIVAVLSNCGLRTSELCSLTLQDLNLADSSILVGRADQPGARQVALDPATLQLIGSYLAWRRELIESLALVDGPDAPLFLSASGHRLTGNGVNALLKSLARTASLAPAEIKANRLRHFAVTSLVDAAVPMDEIKARMGWTPGSEMIYRYPRPAPLRAPYSNFIRNNVGRTSSLAGV